MFTIKGCESNADETILQISDTIDESVRWVDWYTRDGNYGGYEYIAIYGPSGNVERTKEDTGIWDIWYNSSNAIYKG